MIEILDCVLLPPRFGGAGELVDGVQVGRGLDLGLATGEEDNAGHSGRHGARQGGHGSGANLNSSMSFFLLFNSPCLFLLYNHPAKFGNISFSDFIGTKTSEILIK